ncbi:hypothetical protein [uncultured Aquimarina sp.]|uniref:hypothetical protein n=1 Tax=uncultured Aquimarina sp. TaxID=575652 RepID=UPI002620FBDE|nr:hypothetical protein [uncultured Aquimarina sp.]
MRFTLHSKICYLLITSFISSFSFSQDTSSAVIDSLQNDWSLCKYMTNKHYCESNSNRLYCNYQIKFIKNQFILLEDSEKIDEGDFEIQHEYDNAFLMSFYSTFNNEILKLLGSETIKLFNEKEKGFILYAESPANLFVLKKI